MSIKRFGLLLLCVVTLLALGACSKPFGNTPFESGVPYESSDVQDDSIVDDASDPVFGEDSTSNTGKPTTNKPTNNSKPTSTSTPTSSGDSSTDDNQANINWDDLISDITGETTPSTTKNPPTTPTTRPTMQEIAGILLPAGGYPANGEFVNILQVGTVELSGNTVSIEIKNITPNEHFSGKETEQTSYVEYICYDKDGKELLRDKLRFGRIHKQESRVCEFTIPAGTAKVMLGEWVGYYWSNGFK